MKLLKLFNEPKGMNTMDIIGYLLDNYLDEAERMLGEEGNGKRVFRIPVSVEMVDGKYARITAPSNQSIIDNLNGDVDDEDLTIKFTTWEMKIRSAE